MPKGLRGFQKGNLHHVRLDRSEKCLNGHIRTSKNTSYSSSGHRRCKTCANISRYKKRIINGRYKGVIIRKCNTSEIIQGLSQIFKIYKNSLLGRVLWS